MTVIVINLNRAEERREYISKKLKDQNIDFLIYNAFDGSFINNSGINPKISTDSYLSGNDISNNELSCIFSHAGAINLAKSLNLEYAIILEDDVEICNNFKESIEDVIKRLPKNWEHVFIGAHTYNQFNPFTYPSIVPVNFRVSGAYSYIIRNTAYDKLVNRLMKIDTVADDIIEKFIVKEKGLKSYMYYPYLAYPNLYDSYIRNIKNAGMGKKHTSYKYFKDNII